MKILLRGLVRMKGVVFVGNKDEDEEEALIRWLGEVRREVAAEEKTRRERIELAKYVRVEPAQV